MVLSSTCFDGFQPKLSHRCNMGTLICWWGQRSHGKVKSHLRSSKIGSKFLGHCGPIVITEKVYFRSQILERPSIGEYWNISCVSVLPENVIFTSFRTCWCHSEAYNTGTQKWSSIVQYSCTSIWDLKYTFSQLCYFAEGHRPEAKYHNW